MQVKLGENLFMVSGNATKDAELKYVGDKQSALCMFSLAVGKNKDTTTQFANCKAWRNLAEYTSNIVKGCSVCAIGSIEENEYGGKTYKNLVLEWVHFVPPTKPFLGEKAAPVTKDTFKDLEMSDSELPF